MKTKTAVTCLLCCLLTVFAGAAAAADRIAEYDASGIWDIVIDNGSTDCFAGPVADQTNAAAITQSGDTFSLASEDGLSPMWGTVKGTRYTLPHGILGASGAALTQALVWDLKSAMVGEGHLVMIQIQDTAQCTLSADVHLTKRGVCEPDDSHMCLRNGRFEVVVGWRDRTGATGVGHAVPATDDSGLFWFFGPSNMELLIKVLDGCGYNNRYWVFFAATTDQEFKVRVRDLQRGSIKEYTNALGNPADPVTDTAAFATCP